MLVVNSEVQDFLMYSMFIISFMFWNKMSVWENPVHERNRKQMSFYETDVL